MIESLLVPDSDILKTPISVDKAEDVLSIGDLPDHVLERGSAEPTGIMQEEKYLKGSKSDKQGSESVQPAHLMTAEGALGQH